MVHFSSEIPARSTAPVWFEVTPNAVLVTQFVDRSET